MPQHDVTARDRDSRVVGSPGRRRIIGRFGTAPAAVILMVLAGCAGGPPPGRVPPAGTAGIIQPDMPPGYEARLAVHLDRRDAAPRAAQGRWLAGSGNHLLVSAHYGPLVPLMALAVDVDSLYLNLNRQNLFARADSIALLHEGRVRVSAATAGSWLRSVLEPHRLTGLLDRTTAIERDGLRILRGAVGPRRSGLVAEVWIDVAAGRVRKWTLDEGGGHRLMLVEYPVEDWAADDDLPPAVQISWPDQGAVMVVRLTRFSPRETAPSARRFRLDRPPDAREVDLASPVDPLL
ncbi:MAG: hypothetical protein GF355_09720 [Candidatus Eisenbacteria bacterium]|nr:hypothetical protein [Candidatus Eisenbacteria bacterium]